MGEECCRGWVQLHTIRDFVGLENRVLSRPVVIAEDAGPAFHLKLRLSLLVEEVSTHDFLSVLVA